MDCLAILNSGNYVINLARMLEKERYVFEVISTPCQIAKGGCSYCMKFPEEYIELIINYARGLGTPVREIYRIVPLFTRNKYEKIYG